MKKKTKTGLGIAYLYAIITVICSLANYLMVPIFSNLDKSSEKQFTVEISVVFLFCAVICFVLFKLNRNQNQSLGNVFKNNTIRKTTGVLLVISCLISIILYLPAISNAVTQILNKSDDGTVLPNIIVVAIVLFELLIALFFLIYNNKTGDRCETNILTGIAFLFTFINRSFYLISRLSSIAFFHSTIRQDFYLRLAITIIVLALLYIANRKQNQRFISFFQNGIIRKSSGILIMIDGLLGIPSLLMTLLSTIFMIQPLGGFNIYIKLSLIQSVVSILILIFQILIGRYMLKYHNNKGLDK